MRAVGRAAARARRAGGGGAEALSGAGGGAPGRVRRPFGARGSRRSAAGAQRVGCRRVPAVSAWSPSRCAQPGGRNARGPGAGGRRGQRSLTRGSGGRRLRGVPPSTPRGRGMSRGAGRSVGAETYLRFAGGRREGLGRLARQRGSSVEKALHPAQRPPLRTCRFPRGVAALAAACGGCRAWGPRDGQARGQGTRGGGGGVGPGLGALSGGGGGLSPSGLQPRFRHLLGHGSGPVETGRERRTRVCSNPQGPGRRARP